MAFLYFACWCCVADSEQQDCAVIKKHVTRRNSVTHSRLFITVRTTLELARGHALQLVGGGGGDVAIVASLLYIAGVWTALTRVECRRGSASITANRAAACARA